MKNIFNLKIKTILVLISFYFITNEGLLAQTKNSTPAYIGIVTFAKGGFGTYNYPEQEDSIYVFLQDTTNISFKIFRPFSHKASRSMSIDNEKLKLVKRKEYEDIVAPEKSIPTGNYDMKFTTGNAYDSAAGFYTISLSHFGMGDIADLTIIGEDYGLRIDDLLVAHLTKVK